MFKKLSILFMLIISSAVPQTIYAESTGGQPPKTAGPNPTQLLWVYDTDARFHYGRTKEQIVKDASALQWDLHGNIVYAARVSDEYVSVRSLSRDGALNWQNDIYTPTYTQGSSGSKRATGYGLTVNQDGHAYFYSNDYGEERGEAFANLYAIDTQTGDIAWKLEEREPSCRFVGRSRAGVIKLCSQIKPGQLLATKNLLTFVGSDGTEEKKLELTGWIDLSVGPYGNIPALRPSETIETDNIVHRQDGSITLYDSDGNLLYTLNADNLSYISTVSADHQMIVRQSKRSDGEKGYHDIYYDETGAFIWEKDSERVPSYSFIGPTLIYKPWAQSTSAYKYYAIDKKTGTEREVPLQIGFSQLYDRAANNFVLLTGKPKAYQLSFYDPLSLETVRQLPYRFDNENLKMTWAPHCAAFAGGCPNFNEIVPLPSPVLIDTADRFIAGVYESFDGEPEQRKWMIWAARLPSSD
ncbi:hypothetical protein [Paenibacillus hamazuiensis]|uniref:hypothetical protein n=1 Tax=Paenibacillus hamazuiensis TaxID=2936508 RepID=UPI00200C6F34|nr:hypothetical protein [Paenibacillus hamazuiensis]